MREPLGTLASRLYYEGWNQHVGPGIQPAQRQTLSILMASGLSSRKVACPVRETASAWGRWVPTGPAVTEGSAVHLLELAWLVLLPPTPGLPRPPT